MATQSKWPRWVAPAIGITALVSVQVFFVSAAAWPVLLFDDEFVRAERATVVQDAPGYFTRWLIRLENGDLIKMPPPEGMALVENSQICIEILKSPLKTLKARATDPSLCGAD